jgi:hypothetical protein
MDASGHLHNLLALPRYIREDDGHHRLCGSTQGETQTLPTGAEDKTEFTLFSPTDYVHYTRRWTEFAVNIAASVFLKPEGNLNNI